MEIKARPVAKFGEENGVSLLSFAEAESATGLGYVCLVASANIDSTFAEG